MFWELIQDARSPADLIFCDPMIQFGFLEGLNGSRMSTIFLGASMMEKLCFLREFERIQEK